MAPLPTDSFDRILFGAAYYAEYAPAERLETDLDLMADAGFSVIRVGESVWSTWEPRDGEFDVEWLRPVLDGAHNRRIKVILGTPTYAIPPWLQVKHPELAAERESGVRVPWGARQEVNYSSTLFKSYAERIIRRILETYASHPAVVGYQVDNEPGMILFHNDDAFDGFKEYLIKRYGDVETLNNEWGLTYWSHRLTSIDELWRPDGNSFPQYDLAWREYQAEITTDFIHWQARIVREYALAEQFVTTCIAYPRPGQHDHLLAAGLDVAAGNPYYDMQDGLDLQRTVPQGPVFTTTGVGPFFRQADRMWSTRLEPFLVTETNAQSIGGSHQNLPPYPGQLKQAAFAFVSRGARMVEYWHWQTLRSGFETYWGGVLPHSGKPGRVYSELAELGRSLESVGNALAGYTPDADIAILYSNASKWAFNAFPALPDGNREPDPQSYYRIFDAFHTGIIESNRQALIIQDTQLEHLDAEIFARNHPVLIVPAFYIASDASVAWLNAYASSGGHLVLGIRSGYADTQARARAEVAPPGFSNQAGVSYEEYTHLIEPVSMSGDGLLELSPDAAGMWWIDGLINEGADTLASYDHTVFDRFPAITTRTSGAGRITYVGTVPNKALAVDLCCWLAPQAVAGDWASSPANRITVQSGTTPGGHVRFIFNWSGDSVTVTVPETVRNLETGVTVTAGSQLVIEPRGTQVLVQENHRP
ncbi:beta-galactosidase [Arthrobacter sp. KNU40]|uniref:beta-galactosidase n=1 Tax=Arthrobacter sp. KNU40 TaxID=3447965 RepID=UPI003F61B5C9